MAVDLIGDLERDLFGGDAVMPLGDAADTDDLSVLFTHIPNSLCISGLGGVEDNCADLFPMSSFSSDLNCEFEVDLFRNGNLVNDDLWHEISDGSDSGIDCIQTKTEPQSPVSYCSDTSNDSVSHGLSPTGQIVSEQFQGYFSVDELDPGSLEFIAEQSADGIFDVDIKNEDMDTVDTTFTLDDNPDGVFNMLDFDNPSISPTEPMTQVVSASPVFCVSQNGIPVSTTVEVESVSGMSQKNRMKTIFVLPTETVANGGSTLTFVQQAVKPQVKIQPKPVSSARPTAGVTIAGINTGDKSSFGVSRSSISSGRSVLGMAKKDLNTPPPLSPPISLRYSSDIVVSSELDIDLKAVKRQQRMIKNRESACKSRKRKKELLQSLETQLQESAAENDRLKAENLCLKRKLDSLRLENERLKKSLPFGVKAAATTVLTVFVFLSFNWTIISPLGPFSSAEFPSASDIRHGRSLLSVNDSETIDDIISEKSLNFSDDGSWKASASGNHGNASGLVFSSGGGQDRTSTWNGIHDIIMRSLEEKGFKSSSQAMCPTYFNSSESLRLMNELRGWVLGHEEELKREQEVKESEKAKKMRKRYVVPHKLKAAMNGHVNRWNHPSSKYEVQVFIGDDRKYDSFLEAIDRRNDTFYVVSFRRDHLLLPATAHNKTTRPRMSLMMPAMGLNETMQPPVGSIAMMQIDCEVTATRLIHIDRSSVPQHMLSNATVDRRQNDRKSEKLWTRDGSN